MKKALKSLICAVGMALVGASAWASTTTPRTGMTVPAFGDTNWDVQLRADFNIIDASMCVQGLSNTFTGANTFTGPVTMTNSLSAQTIFATGISNGQCLQTGPSGQIIGTGFACGSGGGGGGSTGGSINSAFQNSVGYYSFTGSSNVISGLTAGTSGQILTTQGSAGPPYWTTPAYFDPTSSYGINTYTLLGFNGANNNTWFGPYAFQRVTVGIGEGNNAYGSQALEDDTIGSQNNALGWTALEFNTSGNNLNAVGTEALGLNSTGSQNDAIGGGALEHNTTGTGNDAFGFETCQTNTIGSQVMCLGSGSNVGSNNLTNAIAIGPNATVNTSNTMQLGGSGSNAVNVRASTITLGGEICFPNGSCQTVASNGTGFILNQPTLQSGSQFNVASANVAGNIQAQTYGFTTNGSLVSPGSIFGTNGDIYFSPSQGNRSIIVQGSTLAFISSNGYVGLQAPASIIGSSPLLFTVPSTLGTSSQVLTTDGFGNMNWSNGNFIQNQNTVQNATVFVTSETVNGPFYITPNTGNYSSIYELPATFGNPTTIGSTGILEFDASGVKHTTLYENLFNGIPAPSLQTSGNIDLIGAGLYFKQTTGIPGNSYISFIASQVVTTTQFVLPPADGTSGQALTTDGNHNLSFTTVSGSGGGDSIYPATSTILGTNFLFTGGIQSTVTYGLSAGSITVTGTTGSAGAWIATEGTIPLGTSGAITLTADTTGPALKEIIGTGTSNYVAISSVSASAGQTAYWISPGVLGATSSAGTGSIQNQSTLQVGATAYPDFLQVGTSATFSGATVFNSSVTFNNFHGFTISNASMTVIGNTLYPDDVAFSSGSAGAGAVAVYTVDVSTNGHLNGQAVVGSTVTSCGTAPSFTGSDVHGVITTGSGSPTACTLTFAHPFVNTPDCFCSANGATACDPTSTSATSVTFGLGITETTIHFFCIGSD